MTVFKYAIVDNTDNTVINICLWDGVTPWTPPANTTVVQLADGQFCDIGSVYTP